MIYGGPDFIEMLQKNNKMTCFFHYFCSVGEDIPVWKAWLPGVEDYNGVNGQAHRDQAVRWAR